MPGALYERLKLARERRNLTQRDVAEYLASVGNPKTIGAISSWEQVDNSKTPNLETLRQLSIFYKVSPLWLAWEIGGIEENELGTQSVVIPATRGRAVPRLDMSTAIREPIIRHAQRSDAHTYFDCGPATFILEINDRSNEPFFHVGDVIAVDPDEDPEPGDMVFAHINAGDRGVIRRYEKRASTDGVKYVELRPLNAAWSSDFIRSPEDGRVIGVMTEHAMPRRGHGLP